MCGRAWSRAARASSGASRSRARRIAQDLRGISLLGRGSLARSSGSTLQAPAERLDSDSRMVFGDGAPRVDSQAAFTRSGDFPFRSRSAASRILPGGRSDRSRGSTRAIHAVLWPVFHGALRVRRNAPGNRREDCRGRDGTCRSHPRTRRKDGSRARRQGAICGDESACAHTMVCAACSARVVVCAPRRLRRCHPHGFRFAQRLFSGAFRVVLAGEGCRDVSL